MTPYKIVKVPNGDAWIEFYGKQYSRREIVDKILTNVKQTAETYIGKLASDAIITYPAMSNDAKIKATLAVGEMAGINLEIAIDELVAAAVSYGLIDKDGLIAVFDLGGRKFDFSILEIFRGTGTKGLSFTLTRSTFERLVNHLTETTRNLSEIYLKEAGITAMDVDKVLLAGGMARVPKIQEVVTKLAGFLEMIGKVSPICGLKGNFAVVRNYPAMESPRSMLHAMPLMRA
ncbi:hypothetical protein IFM89_022506 [Coptis chinensis]|uniref:Heat shock protein 70 n=1 Tax=Coptis chinensis TaxID=261450 RepID=A0A835IE62_9MAGN|nr:hypothetical protein IFM89_022506 [Coptis chinensis]